MQKKENATVFFVLLLLLLSLLGTAWVHRNEWLEAAFWVPTHLTIQEALLDFFDAMF